MSASSPASRVVATVGHREQTRQHTPTPYKPLSLLSSLYTHTHTASLSVSSFFPLSHPLFLPPSLSLTLSSYLSFFPLSLPLTLSSSLSLFLSLLSSSSFSLSPPPLPLCCLLFLPLSHSLYPSSSFSLSSSLSAHSQNNNKEVCPGNTKFPRSLC